ncbi:MAG: DUF1902 domain-containing protein [Proteobacteria bacterium]|nr:DUF1902 domain-containing protein [Pseudomonadota bacterium]
MKPVIFIVTAQWDEEAAVWSGHSDDVPVVVEAPTLDELLGKAAAQTLDLLPDNHPGVDPASVHLQLIVLREAASIPAAA